MASEDAELSLPLSEFVKLPTTVDFQIYNTNRLQSFVQSRPYIRLGTEFENGYIVGYVNQQYVQQLLDDLSGNFLYFFPRILSPTDSQSNDATGTSQIQSQPFLNLTGRGVIIGIVDTGIDYRKPAFSFEDGSTKILSIWDQTIDGNRPEELYFGAVYTAGDIDAANASDAPYEIVPSKDEDGHGTFLASVAASNEPGEYLGAAPKAYLICVKLRRARQYLIDRYLVTEDNPNLYESTDFMLGMKYVIDESRRLGMPLVMCIGMGTNGGAHDGSALIEEYISFVSQRVGYAFITAVGNEANTRHHTQGVIPATKATERIAVRVGTQGASFTVTINSPGYDKISVGITSPTGEAVSRVSFRSGLEYRNRLILENTSITIRYYRDSNNTVTVSLQNATQGIWNIILYGDLIVGGEYWAWLPITGQVDADVEFMRPVPDYTVVVPATALRAIKCGAYNSKTQSLLVSSSWGPTRLYRVAPDFVAPGVDVKGIYPTGYGTMTGTSVAAAVTAGITALLLQWGIVNGNKPSMDSDLIRSYLISGCRRERNLTYPNPQWGFGKVNLSGTFDAIKESSPDFSESFEEGGF